MDNDSPNNSDDTAQDGLQQNTLEDVIPVGEHEEEVEDQRGRPASAQRSRDADETRSDDGESLRRFRANRSEFSKWRCAAWELPSVQVGKGLLDISELLKNGYYEVT